MLNRFRNALYGTSSDQETHLQNDSSSLNRVDKEVVLTDRLRSVIKRSTSFQEYLSFRHNQDDNHGNGRILNQKHLKRQISNNRETLNRSRSNHDMKYDFVEEPGVDYRMCSKLPRYRYLRPEFLQLRYDDEILVSADHQIRPIILPRDTTKLPWKSGYAECINAGKSIRNEDQAACYHDVIVRDNPKSSTIKQGGSSASTTTTAAATTTTTTTATIRFGANETKLPWYYFAIFDGHAGSAVAVAASVQLHNIIGDKLNQISDLLMALEFDFDGISSNSANNSDTSDNDSDDCEDEDEDFSEEGQPKSLETLEETDKEEVEGTSETEPIKEGEANDSGAKSIDEPDKFSEVGEEQNNNTGSNKISDTSAAVSVAASAAAPIEEKQTVTTTSRHSAANQKLDRKDLEANLNLLTKSNAFPSMIEICRNGLTVDSLITGVLESSFWQMDAQIAKDKNDYFMPGGCTAIVSLFIFGKLYVCNAGDSRAIVYKNEKVIPMSYDFTPISEKERILRLGMQRPELLKNEFTHLEFLKRPTRRDLGKLMLYKDAYMTGWTMKVITYDDLKFPLVWGEGKRSRVLATIGVTRGFGDHELKAQYGSVPIKPFLTPEPEVKILELEKSDVELTSEDVLMMGSDGLWDVTSNEEAASIVKNSFNSTFPNNEESRSRYRYVTAAQDLVIHSRGQTTSSNNIWRTSDNKLASLDDIAVFVIPLKQYRDEYLVWKRDQLSSTSSSSSSKLNRKSSRRKSMQSKEGSSGG